MLRSTALAGPEWPELGDAGNLPGTAQTPFGSGQINKIIGNLDGNGGFPGPGGDFQDMYAIWIDDPALFSASTSADLGGFADFDTQLFLFQADGRGALANDNSSSLVTGSTLLPAATDGSGFVLSGAGLYYLAISGFDSDPLGGSEFIFDQVDPSEISGPDGIGGSLPITDWSPLAGEIGHYEITLTGVRGVPAPGAAALLALAGMCGRRRRRG